MNIDPQLQNACLPANEVLAQCGGPQVRRLQVHRRCEFGDVGTHLHQRLCRTHRVEAQLRVVTGAHKIRILTHCWQPLPRNLLGNRPRQQSNAFKICRNIQKDENAQFTSSVASAARFTTNNLGSMGLSATAGGFRPSTSPERVTAGLRTSGLDRSTKKLLNS